MDRIDCNSLECLHAQYRAARALEENPQEWKDRLIDLARDRVYEKNRRPVTLEEGRAWTEALRDILYQEIADKQNPQETVTLAADLASDAESFAVLYAESVFVPPLMAGKPITAIRDYHENVVPLFEQSQGLSAFEKQMTQTIPQLDDGNGTFRTDFSANDPDAAHRTLASYWFGRSMIAEMGIPLGMGLAGGILGGAIGFALGGPVLAGAGGL